jgi:hypothetical protein
LIRLSIISSMYNRPHGQRGSGVDAAVVFTLTGPFPRIVCG